MNLTAFSIIIPNFNFKQVPNFSCVCATFSNTYFGTLNHVCYASAQFDLYFKATNFRMKTHCHLNQLCDQIVVS